MANQPKTQSPLKAQLPFASPRETVGELLDRLSELTPLRTWVLAEVREDRWIVRACHDHAFGFSVDQFLNWNDSVCRSMMVKGGPQFAPNVKAFEHLSNASVTGRLGIASYLGVPIRIPGRWDGMLCGLDDHAVKGRASHLLPLAETFGRVLAGAWAQHLMEEDAKLVA